MVSTIYMSTRPLTAAIRTVSGLLILIILSSGAPDSLNIPRPVLRQLQARYRENNFKINILKETSGCKTGTIGQLTRSDGKMLGYVYWGKVNTCRGGGCSTPDIPREADHSDFFRYFILFDTVGRVEKIKVYEYASLHGHGITSERWLKQFIGYSGQTQLRPGKEIDGLSGATTSVNAFVKDLENTSKCLENFLQNAFIIPR